MARAATASTSKLTVSCVRARAGSELLELGVRDDGTRSCANVVFAPIQDRRGRSILSVRDQNTFDDELRRSG